MSNSKILCFDYEVTYDPTFTEKEIDEKLHTLKESVESNWKGARVLPPNPDIVFFDRRTRSEIEFGEVHERLNKDDEDGIDTFSDSSSDEFRSKCEEQGISMVEYTNFSFGVFYELGSRAFLREVVQTEESLEKILSDGRFEGIHLNLMNADTMTPSDFDKLYQDAIRYCADDCDEDSDDGF